jgi:hypothetical protein
VTRVFYEQNGAITEADIALNPTQLFSTDKTPGTFDLEAVLTHEIGHLLGLSHAVDASSVMFEGVPRIGAAMSGGGMVNLSADDRIKIQSLYGPQYALENCCAKVRARVNNVADPATNYLIWLQNSQTGALEEVNYSKANRFVDFSPNARGTYEVLAQGASSIYSGAPSAVSSIKDIQSDQNVIFSGIGRPLPFDIQLIGINGELSRRAVAVERGGSYRLLIAGPGLSDPGVQIAATSKGITIEPLKSEVWFAKNGTVSKAFQLLVSRSVLPGQYSIYAQDPSGHRRYFVGGIGVN